MRLGALWAGEELVRSAPDALPSVIRLLRPDPRVFCYAVLDYDSAMRVRCLSPVPKQGLSLDLRAPVTWEWRGDLLAPHEFESALSPHLPAMCAHYFAEQVRRAQETQRTALDIDRALKQYRSRLAT